MKLVRISSSWCSSCIITHKMWKELMNTYKDFKFEEYDFDEDEEKVKKYNVGNILPVIIVFDEEKEIKRIIGEKSKKELFDSIEELVK